MRTKEIHEGLCKTAAAFFPGPYGMDRLAWEAARAFRITAINRCAGKSDFLL